MTSNDVCWGMTALVKGNPNKMTELVVPKLVWMFQKETIRRN